MITTEDPIYFGGVNINTVSGWRTTGTDIHRLNRDVKNYSIANSNLTATTSAFFNGKPIHITGVLALQGRELLDESISELFRIFEPINQTLQLPVMGSQRKFYEVTMSNIGISDIGGGYASIDIELVTSDPYNYSIITTELLNVINLTSGNKSYPVTFEGKGKQVPVITYTVDSFTSGTNRTITFSNPSGSTITIQRTWLANDIMVIDCKEKTVTVNGTEVDFTGNFPEWNKGEGFVNYTDDFTARQVDINIIYTKRYL